MEWTAVRSDCIQILPFEVSYGRLDLVAAMLLAERDDWMICSIIGEILAELMPESMSFFCIQSLMSLNRHPIILVVMPIFLEFTRCPWDALLREMLKWSSRGYFVILLVSIAKLDFLSASVLRDEQHHTRVVILFELCYARMLLMMLSALLSWDRLITILLSDEVLMR